MKKIKKRKLKNLNWILYLHLGIVILLFSSSLAIGIPDESTVKEKTRNLKILTSFPPDFYSQYLEVYKKRNPSLQIQVLNKKTTAALTEIQRGNIREFDIFWSSSPDAFTILKDNGKLRHSGYPPSNPPLNSNNYLSSDTGGYFFNFAISGMGYMWNEKVLEEAGISKPSSWYDLAHPRFYGYLAASAPSRSGTTHLIVESLLQGMGWKDGWRFLFQVCGNFETITARSFSVPDGVASGRFGVGLVIDFLAINKMYSQREIGFSYGSPVLIMPAGVAVLKNGANAEEAIAFIDFILSDEGQQILLKPTIGRLPVSGSFSSSQKQEFHPLMKLLLDGPTLPYDTALSKGRYLLVNNLFDQLITYRLLERRQLWKKLIQLEKIYGYKGIEKTDIRNHVLDLLCQVPVTEEQSLSSSLNHLFSASATGNERESRRKLLKKWDEFLTSRLEQADIILTEAYQLIDRSPNNLQRK